MLQLIFWHASDLCVCATSQLLNIYSVSLSDFIEIFQVEIVGFEKCRNLYGNGSADGAKMICAGGSGKGACLVSVFASFLHFKVLWYLAQKVTLSVTHSATF